MCADHTTNDETVLRLATREELCGPVEPRMPLTDAEAALVAAPVASLSPQEIGPRAALEILRCVDALTRHEDGRRMAREILSVIERAIQASTGALTAENARLTSEREKHLVLLSTMADMLTTATQGSHAALIRHERETYEQREQIGALKAENAELRRRVEADHAAAKTTAADAAFAAVVSRQIDRAERADRLWNAPMEDVIAAIQQALTKGGEAESPRRLTPDEIEAGSHLLTRAKDDGIDMDRLGRLCREEPDADTGREVGDMMRGLYAAMEDSPLSHPRYPDLVKMARESSKDGD